MTDNRKPPQQPQGARGPRFVWVVRPKFTHGDCRSYFSKEDAIADFGRPAEMWIDYGHILEIDKAPVWDPFDVAWVIEKVEVRAISKQLNSIPT
jgi:hypothetical protein